jgi:hypothetical protein
MSVVALVTVAVAAVVLAAAHRPRTRKAPAVRTGALALLMGESRYVRDRQDRN